MAPGTAFHSARLDAVDAALEFAERYERGRAEEISVSGEDRDEALKVSRDRNPSIVLFRFRSGTCEFSARCSGTCGSIVDVPHDLAARRTIRA